MTMRPPAQAAGTTAAAAATADAKSGFAAAAAAAAATSSSAPVRSDASAGVSPLLLLLLLIWLAVEGASAKSREGGSSADTFAGASLGVSAVGALGSIADSPAALPAVPVAPRTTCDQAAGLSGGGGGDGFRTSCAPPRCVFSRCRCCCLPRPVLVLLLFEVAPLCLAPCVPSVPAFFSGGGPHDLGVARDLEEEPIAGKSCVREEAREMRMQRSNQRLAG